MKLVKFTLQKFIIQSNYSTKTHSLKIINIEYTEKGKGNAGTKN